VVGKSNISGIIARQVGTLKGRLVSQIQSTVLDILKKFSNKCPNSKELQKIIKIRNTLITHITSFESRVRKFSSLADKLSGAITTAKAAVKVIKSIPIPTAIIPPMSGGLGIPINILTRYSDTLIQLDKLITRLEDEKNAILSIVNTTLSTLVKLKNKLESVDIAIQICASSTGNNSADLVEILGIAQPPISSESLQQGEIYKGYKLLIQQDPNSPAIAPKRYAIAQDGVGITVIYGPSSFSSNTEVLIDELKFRIDNYLP